MRPWQHVLEPLSGYLILAEKLENYNGCSITSPTTYDSEGNLSYNGGLLPENGLKIFLEWAKTNYKVF